MCKELLQRWGVSECSNRVKQPELINQVDCPVCIGIYTCFDLSKLFPPKGGTIFTAYPLTDHSTFNINDYELEKPLFYQHRLLD